MTIEDRLKELNIELPALSAPPGNFVAFVQTGNLLYLAGAGPKAKGKVGVEYSVEEAQEFARDVAIQHVAVIKSALGNLDRVARVVKALGMINAGPEFEQHPAVMNGYSDCMVDIFGDKGLHARSAIGMASLPFGIPVEVEAIIEISLD
jgi:enamine deaminase RidA (YjgF/YER057c/UK114 family)|tara:strand:+ start:1165 stop:1611 length:447 start_codon:yes stop_codon:yes gene_type:complete